MECPQNAIIAVNFPPRKPKTEAAPADAAKPAVAKPAEANQQKLKLRLKRKQKKPNQRLNSSISN